MRFHRVNFQNQGFKILKLYKFLPYKVIKAIHYQKLQKTNIFCPKKNHSFLDPCQKRIPKWAEMAPQKARNDPNMLKIPKIFDFSHEMIRFKFLYRGSTKDLIRIVLIRYYLSVSIGPFLGSFCLKNLTNAFSIFILIRL